MLEIIALVFLSRQIGTLAYRKGLKPGRWKLYLVLAWFFTEIIGFFTGVAMFGTHNLLGLMLFSLICAVGGYLFIRARLLKMPDSMDDEIEKIGK